jgi:hypothetical protein
MTVEEEQENVYVAIGRGIFGWSGLEFALGRLFAQVLTEDQLHPGALLAYSAPESFHAKLQLVYSMMGSMNKVVRDPVIAGRWSKIAAWLPTPRRNRNRLAHHDIFINKDGPEGRRVWVVPQIVNPDNLAQLGRNKGQMCLADIEAAIATFSALTKEIGELIRAFPPPSWGSRRPCSRRSEADGSAWRTRLGHAGASEEAPIRCGA